jgi:hypothetical protein
MENPIKEIKEKYSTKNYIDYIQGLDLSIKVIEEIVSEGMNLMEIVTPNKIFIVERLAAFFNLYVSNLNHKFNSNDQEIKYWASTLLIHHSICHPEAEKFLLDIVISGELQKAELATTILLRKKHTDLKAAIKKRLASDKNMAPETITFFKEKMEIA